MDESSEKTFTIKNICNFEVNFILKDEGEGIKNSNSSRAISYIPMSGRIPPNDSVDVKVKFVPDRIGEKYYNKIKIFVPEQKTERYLYVSGSCFPRQAFVTDFKPSIMPSNEEVSRNAEYALDWLRMKDEDIIYGQNNKQIILKFKKATS